MSEVKLILGDCLEVMRGMEAGSVDAVITDPPYGIGRDKGFEGFGGFGTPIARKQYHGDWDDKRPDKVYFDEILRIAKTVLIFGGNYFTDYLPVSNHWVAWDKRNTMPSFGDCELVWTNVPRNSVKMITKEYNGLIGKERERFHATQKPLKIIHWLINNYVSEKDVIFDPFAGSGTTGVAALQTGHDAILVERDPIYFKIAERRIHDAQQQMPLEFES